MHGREEEGNQDFDGKIRRKESLGRSRRKRENNTE
jgi:hypothetical protein